jgi:hypothetical protein
MTDKPTNICELMAHRDSRVKQMEEPERAAAFRSELDLAVRRLAKKYDRAGWQVSSVLTRLVHDYY